jgi:two-component system nitrate/nitrite response regulator NarL
MKLMIVDDHTVVREGLAALLRQIGPDTEILPARNADEALEQLASHPDLDVVLLDLTMPGMDGMSALIEFGRRRPELPVIVLSSSEDAHDARKALSLGALGYVPKSASQHALLSAIKLVMNGELYVPPLILAAMGAMSPGAYDVGKLDGRGRLTARQVEVLRLLSEGRSNKEISAGLDLSEKTVKAHITAIFKALNVVSRTQAANAGRAQGLIA